MAVRPLEMAFVDATDATAHVRALQASGVMLEDVARRTGVSLATVRTLYGGCRWTTKAAATQLLRFSPTETVSVPLALVEQLRAARANGFSLVRLALLVKLPPDAVGEILNGAAEAKGPIVLALQAMVAALPVKPVPAPLPPAHQPPPRLVPVGRGPHAKVMSLLDAGVSRATLAEVSGVAAPLIARICHAGPNYPVSEDVKVRLATLSADPAAYPGQSTLVGPEGAGAAPAASEAVQEPKAVQEPTHSAAEAREVLTRLRAHFSERHLRRDLHTMAIPSEGVSERYWQKLWELDQLLPGPEVAVPQLALLDPGSWQDHAACAASEVDLNWFFSHDRLNQAKALAVCRRCPVREACEREALDNREDYGIWGGFTSDELRRKRGLKPIRQPA